MSSESYIQKKITDYLTKLGWYVVKTIVTNRNGTPDILACDTGGRFWAFEVKYGKNKASKLQEYHVKTINDLGGHAHVVWSLEEVKEIING